MNKTILIATIALVSMALFGKPLFAQDKPANERIAKGIPTPDLCSF